MLSTTHTAEVGNFNTEAIGQLTVALRGGVDAVSTAGAVDLTKFVTELTVANTVAYTMAAPTVDKQRKLIRCVAVSGTPLGTVTITNPDATAGFVCPSTMIFTAVGQEVEFEAVNISGTLKWRVHRLRRSGTQTLVIGTTLTAGMVLSAVYACSVTGTVNSTGSTKQLPDGIMPGEFVVVTNPTAQCTPVGALDFTGVTLAGAAVTHLQAIGATTDTVTLFWTGVAWLPIINSGITVA
jgi:hypothetical protein